MLTFKDTLRGREYFGTVGIQNGGPREHTYRFETSGDTAPWLSFVSTGTARRSSARVDVPRNSTQVTVRAVVPPSVQNGDYGGTIRVLTTTTNRSGVESSGAGVTIGAELIVNLRHRHAEDRRSVSSTRAHPTSNQATCCASRRRSNTGNVEVNPTIDVDIVDTAGNPIDHLTSSDLVVYPNDRKQIITEWEHDEQNAGRAHRPHLGEVRRP